MLMWFFCVYMACCTETVAPGGSCLWRQLDSGSIGAAAAAAAAAWTQA